MLQYYCDAYNIIQKTKQNRKKCHLNHFCPPHVGQNIQSNCMAPEHVELRPQCLHHNLNSGLQREADRSQHASLTRSHLQPFTPRPTTAHMRRRQRQAGGTGEPKFISHVGQQGCESYGSPDAGARMALPPQTSKINDQISNRTSQLPTHTCQFGQIGIWTPLRTAPPPPPGHLPPGKLTCGLGLVNLALGRSWPPVLQLRWANFWK